MTHPPISTGPAAGAAWARSGAATFPEFVPTVPALLRHAIAHHPDNLAVATPTERLTYRELDERSADLAALFVQRGVGKGTKVGILLPNGVEFVVTWLAAARLGAVTVPVNTFSTAPEMATMLRHADVQLLVACPSFLAHDYVAQLASIAPELAGANAPEPLLVRALPQLRHVLMWGEAGGASWAELIELGAHRPGAVVAVARAMEDDVVPADPMLITYTSGSTGEPKGVVHGAGPLLRHARNLAALSGIGPRDRVWTPMPLCWVGGFSFTLLRALVVGAAFVTQDRMDATAALELLEREQVTCISAWPTIAASFLNHPDFPRRDLSALRYGSFPEGRPAALRPADPGLAVGSLGMSETAGPHTFWTAEEDLAGVPEQYRGAFGHEVPGMSHRIVDQDGNDVPEGTEGRVVVRGYALMLGLYKRERHEVVDPDGWYHTDDRGLFRDGWFFFTGRQSDLIKTKGANVAAVEVERALVAIDGVQAAFVFGLSHEEMGQEVVALVVRSGGPASPSVEELGLQLRDHLSSYKVPRRIVDIDATDVVFLTSQKADRRAMARLAERLVRGES